MLPGEDITEQIKEMLTANDISMLRKQVRSSN